MNKIRAAGLGTHDVVFLGAGFEDIAIKQKLHLAARRGADAGTRRRRSRRSRK